MAETEMLTLPMVCTCNEEGRSAALATMDEVRRRFARGLEGLVPLVLTPGDFLRRIVVALGDCDAFVSGIHVDQWYRVVVTTYDGALQVEVDCDEPEDGLAAAWLALIERAQPVEYR